LKIGGLCKRAGRGFEKTYESAGEVDACGASVRGVEPLRFRKAEEAMFRHSHAA